MTNVNPSPANGTKEAIVYYSYQRALHRLSEAMDSGGDPQAGDVQLVMLMDMRTDMRALRESLETRLGGLSVGPSLSDEPSSAGKMVRPIILANAVKWGPPAGIGAALTAIGIYVLQELLKLLGQ